MVYRFVWSSLITCHISQNLKGEQNSMDNPKAPPIVEAALAYARNGWPVFPLHNKRPYEYISPGVKSNGYKDATTDEETIREWWTYHPGATIGLATGSVSGI